MRGDATVVLPREDVQRLCRGALLAAGARPRVADLLTEAARFAPDRGRAGVEWIMSSITRRPWTPADLTAPPPRS